MSRVQTSRGRRYRRYSLRGEERVVVGSRDSEAKRRRLEHRIADAAEVALTENSYVAPVDVLVRIGWLPSSVVDAWRKGRVDDVETQAQVGPDRLAEALVVLGEWAQERGLQPSEASYVAATRDRRSLRFTADDESTVERAYRTHWMSPELTGGQRRRVMQRQNQPPDLVVIMPLKDFTCSDCGRDDGDLLIMARPGPLCLTCADMDHLVFLPAGDATLTRRAKKASGLSAVVVRFSRSRKRYERQGILVEQAALEQAEESSLADKELRSRRRERDRERRANEDIAFQTDLAAAVRRLFPGCPPPRAESIARHTGQRGSGRVGRSAAGRALDEGAVTGAVVASVRHEETQYDELLMSGVPRDEARERVRPEIDRILDQWRHGH